MTQRYTLRNLTADVAAPAIAAGILIAGIVAGGTAIATAQPMDSQCTNMAMTSGANQPAPNGMTRAGMIASATGPSASDTSMAAPCQPASHS
jgi:hypothetical protein